MIASARALTRKKSDKEKDLKVFKESYASLGSRLKRIRQQKELTIQQVSDRGGIASSTISKIENDHLSPTFDIIQRLAIGLDIDLAQVFGNEISGNSGGRRSVTRSHQGDFVETKEYVYEALSTELRAKKMFPLKATIRARELEEFGGWVRHEGEEFLIVVSGEVRVYTEYYEPVDLTIGDSIYLDSQMGHACVSISPEDAQVVWVCTQVNLDFLNGS